MKSLQGGEARTGGLSAEVQLKDVERVDGGIETAFEDDNDSLIIKNWAQLTEGSRRREKSPLTTEDVVRVGLFLGEGGEKRKEPTTKLGSGRRPLSNIEKKKCSTVTLIKEKREFLSVTREVAVRRERKSLWKNSTPK